MNLLQCLLINNDCYKAGAKLKPKGVMVHSTGANNPNIKRYVQPVRGEKDYSTLVAALGKNTNSNDWNRAGTGKCVHAFIGKLADGSIATVQTLPWDMRGWHCGGAANSTHIGFEICEDKLEDLDYFKATYREAVELTAYLCRKYGLDPLAEGVVIGHGEGYKLGVASNRSVNRDPWFGPFGYSMDGFRQDVADLMSDSPQKGEDMTGEEIYNKLMEYMAGRPLPDWARQEWQEAIDEGITDGTEPMRPITRVEAAIMAVRTIK